MTLQHCMQQIWGLPLGLPRPWWLPLSSPLLSQLQVIESYCLPCATLPCPILPCPGLPCTCTVLPCPALFAMSHSF